MKETTTEYVLWILSKKSLNFLKIFWKCLGVTIKKIYTGNFEGLTMWRDFLNMFSGKTEIWQIFLKQNTYFVYIRKASQANLQI